MAQVLPCVIRIRSPGVVENPCELSTSMLAPDEAIVLLIVAGMTRSVPVPYMTVIVSGPAPPSVMETGNGCSRGRLPPGGVE